MYSKIITLKIAEIDMTSHEFFFQRKETYPLLFDLHDIN